MAKDYKQEYEKETGEGVLIPYEVYDSYYVKWLEDRLEKAEIKNEIFERDFGEFVDG